ncbi:hypothetical protein I302_104381 [Kwoniella bestiolae CBS 10118]|uniref:Uncharacterized protein n=1 Tax=Kwoniella bestiolae CBS 10118 TaxID=1296100 RepID=A0A1B9GB36_9TREE|nr:hypothetical protein I302_03089 [Kwoniella bestiolae CBS 10118]OCF28237.1 hypothetical protein I302_03089 [Kwoniella bestiolae CBS 10118]
MSNPNSPPTYEESLYVASSSRRPLSRKKKSTQGIGGDVVGSMKRGLKVDQRNDHRKEGRLRLLLGIAGLLFLILTTIWVIRLNKRITDKGGWSNLYGVISQRIFSPTSPKTDKQEL